MRRRLPTACLACLSLLALVRIVAAAPPAPRSAATYLPKDALATVVLRDGASQVRAGRAWLDEREFFESITYRRIAENPGFAQAQLGALGLAAAAGLDSLSAFEVLAGREAALGIYKGSGSGPRVLLVVATHKPAELDRLIHAVHALTGMLKDGKPDEARSREVDGVRVFALSAQECHCRFDDLLLISNDRDLMQAALALRASPDESVAASAAFRATETGLPKDALLWASADLATLRAQIPGAEKLMDRSDNPLGGFLFGGWRQALAQGDSIVLWARARADEFALEGAITAREPIKALSKGLAPRELVRQSWSAGDLPRFLGEMTVTRGWAELFADRETLLQLPAAGDVVNFNNSISSLLGGMDFMSDVLPRVAGPTRLILANQDFSASRLLPTPELPAFALVTPLKMEGSEFAQRLYSGAQTVVSVINVDNAQQKRPTYLVDTERYRGQRMMTASYPESDAEAGMDMDAPPREMKPVPDDANPDSKPETKSPATGSSPARRSVPIRYNFAPAVVVVQDHFVIATSLPLLKDVIDRVLDAKPATASGDAPLDALVLEAGALATILRANRSELVTQRMLEQDLPKARAEGDIDTVLELVGMTRSLRARAYVDGHAYRAEIVLRFQGDK